MVGVKTLGETSFNFVSADRGTWTLKNLDDYVTSNESQKEKAISTPPIVFVGYGIKAPEYGWDDYKGVDLKGKVALLFVNEPISDDPKFFKGKELTYYGRWSYKFEETARRGALATLIIHRTDLASYGWRWSGTPGARKVVSEAGWIAEAASGFVDSRRSGEKARRGGGADLDKLFEQAQSREFQSDRIASALASTRGEPVAAVRSRNVLAALLGRDPILREEAVLYTAHYDHLGIDPDKKDTTFTTARWIMPRGAASSWNWHARGRR